jgi:hypothetical protein
MRYGRLVHDLLRVGFAVTAAAAMAYQFAKLDSSDAFSPANFFSFFTIQSNVLAALALVLAALVRRDERSRTFDALRGAATFYIAITGVVFSLLLSGLQEDLDTHIGWVNFVVHYLIPVVVVADWFVDPPQHRLGIGVALAWLVYPLAWFAYTLIRGSAVDWYPYPFVDVERHGYGGVLARGVVFAVAFALGAVLFAWVSDRRSGATRRSR